MADAPQQPDPPLIDLEQLRQGIDLLREATAFLRTLRFKNSPDGRQLLGMLNDSQIRIAESRAMFGVLPPKKARPKPPRGGLDA